MRKIGYTRVSSSSPEQLHALDQHKARLESAGCTELYWDIGSRSRADREGLNRVLGLIQSRQCDEVVFIRLDRITDSPVVLEKAITVCLESGIPIMGLDDAIDFTTVGGRLHARILCNMARAEVERLSERVKHGHQHHRDRGAAYFAPFGYVKVGDRLELDHQPFLCLLDGCSVLSRAAVARDLIDTFLRRRSLRGTLQDWNQRYGIRTHAGRGMGNKQARGKLGFHPSALAAWLNNPILRGHLCYGRGHHQRQSHKHLWDIRYNTHPDHRLLTDEEYRQIEEILEWNSQHGGFRFRSETIHPLSGLVYCGQCGGSCRTICYSLRTDRTVKRYSYQCVNYRYRSCDQKTSVRESVLEAALIAALCSRSEAIAAIAAASDSKPESPELQTLKVELSYYQAAPGGRAAAIIADLERQIIDLRYQQNQTTSAAIANQDLLEAFASPECWDMAMPEEKRDVYRALVDRILICDGRVLSVSLKV